MFRAHVSAGVQTCGRPASDCWAVAPAFAAFLWMTRLLACQGEALARGGWGACKSRRAVHPAGERQWNVARRG
jgi:hypothetical protein